MMWHALSGKGGISIKQSQQWGASRIHKIWTLKHHARIGHVERAIIRVKNWCARLESSIQLVFLQQLRSRSFHGINRICPVKIQDLFSIQVWRAAWCSLRGKTNDKGVDSCTLPSANDLLNTSWFPGSIARLTCLAMVRNEECLISAGWKSSCKHIKVIMNIMNIKHINNIIWCTFVIMDKSFLASTRDAVQCVK